MKNLHYLIVSLFSVTVLSSMDKSNKLSSHLQLPTDIWVTIASRINSDDKNNLKQVCQTLNTICTKNNSDLYYYNTLNLSLKQKNYALALGVYKELPVIVNNLINNGADPKTTVFELSLMDIAQLYTKKDYSAIQDKTTIHRLAKHSIQHNAIPHYIIASFFGDTNYLQKRLDDPNADWSFVIPKSEKNILDVAINNNQIKVIELLARYNEKLKLKVMLNNIINKPYIIDLLLFHKFFNVNDTLSSHLIRGTGTLLDIAAHEGLWQTVETVCKWQTGQNKLCNHTNALYFAIEKGHINIVTTLLGRSDIIATLNDNVPIPVLFTALLRALLYDHTDIFQLLLQQKTINPLLFDERGDTLLSKAIVYSNTKIIEIIINNVPELVNKHTQYNSSPLHISVRRENILVTQLLLATLIINVNGFNNKQETPLDIAYEVNNEALITLLIQHGAKTNRTITLDSYKKTAKKFFRFA